MRPPGVTQLGAPSMACERCGHQARGTDGPPHVIELALVVADRRSRSSRAAILTDDTEKADPVWGPSNSLHVDSSARGSPAGSPFSDSLLFRRRSFELGPDNFADFGWFDTPFLGETLYKQKAATS
jgi:hypothetical protein